MILPSGGLTCVGSGCRRVQGLSVCGCVCVVVRASALRASALRASACVWRYASRFEFVCAAKACV
jgi:hypothetical protein